MTKNKKYQLPGKVEFYITNVCNLSCSHCNRFNNYDFSGWQRWGDYETDYQKLSKYIEIQSIVLLGGEPLLNPTITDWVKGLNKIFGASTQLLTNGTRLNKVLGLYDLLLYPVGKTRARNHIGVSLHDNAHFELLRQEILSFLKPPIVEWGPLINTPVPLNYSTWNASYAALDVNNVLINMFRYDKFIESSLQHTPAGFMIHNSNPLVAHENCGFVKYKSYHFIRGEMYKCGPVALMPEFDQQHTILLTNEDRQLLNSYRPLTADNINEYGDEFFANLDNPIPQCKFCPECPSGREVVVELKGPKLI